MASLSQVVLWVVTLLSDVVGYQRFGAPCYFHLRGDEFGRSIHD